MGAHNHPTYSVDVNPNAALPSDVRTRVENLDRETCDNWGGIWNDGTCRVRPFPGDASYTTHTQVRSPEDALRAFLDYTDWFEHALTTYEPASSECVLLPCGSQKPIGSSAIHQKKLTALKNADFYPRCDIIIISEPCTIIPHEWRLHRPPVNYDFPPEYTEQDTAPDVYELFTDRLSRFIDAMDYDVYHPYLVSGHQDKFETAVEKAETNPTTIRIPGSSYGIESGNLSGDLFKSVDDITAKLDMVDALVEHGDRTRVSHYPDGLIDAYASREDYQPLQ